MPPLPWLSPAHKIMNSIFKFSCKDYVSCVIKYHVDADAFHARDSLQPMIRLLNKYAYVRSIPRIQEVNY